MIRNDVARASAQAALFDDVPVPVWVCSTDGADAAGNRAWQQYTGLLTAVGFLGLSSVVHPRDVDRVTKRWKEASANGVARAWRCRLRRSDGVFRWHEIRVAPVQHTGAEVVYWIAVCTDAQDDGRYEESYRRFADAVPHVVVITDRTGAAVYFNRRWSEFTGEDATLLRGEDWQNVIHVDDKPSFRAAWARALTSGEPFEWTARMRRFDGMSRWFLNRAMPMRDEDGVIGNWFQTSTDIDDRVRTSDRLRLVAEATTLMAAQLDEETTVQQLADVVAGVFADWCVVYVYHEQNIARPLAVSHDDATKLPLAREIFMNMPVAYDTTEPVLIGKIDETIFAEHPRLRALSEIGTSSLIAIPLGNDRQRLGLLLFGKAQKRRDFDENDLDLAKILGRRASIAIGNARLYERRDRVARTLQNAFLPEALPVVEGVGMAAYYEPGAEAEIGGDWYDAFTLEDGTIFFSIGDVAGHGLGAAVPMGKMRQAFRALTTIERDPSVLLRMADAILRREHPDVFVTAIAGMYLPRTRTLTYAAAGHPAPFVRPVRGPVARLPGGGVPLGLQDVIAFENVRVTLSAGDLLVLMTDGLLEARHDIAEGEARVEHALRDPAIAVVADPAALFRVLAGSTATRDDTAILTLRAGTPLGWTFDARDRATAQRVRKHFVEARRCAQIGEEQTLADEIVFGELLGNVARYTPGMVDVALTGEGDRSILELVDRGPGFAWNGTLPSDIFSEDGRGQFLVSALARPIMVRHIPGYGNHIRVELPCG
jgi:PAS domain S-box-containing protein